MALSVQFLLLAGGAGAILATRRKVRRQMAARGRHGSAPAGTGLAEQRRLVARAPPHALSRLFGRFGQPRLLGAFRDCLRLTIASLHQIGQIKLDSSNWTAVTPLAADRSSLRGNLLIIGLELTRNGTLSFVRARLG